MRILGIDYGKSKVGLAIAESSLPYPLGVVRFKTEDDLLDKILNIVKEEKIEKLVVGLSEGKMEKETLAFVAKLGERLSIPIFLQDETLTTLEAQKLSIEAGIGQKKRKRFEDAYSACLILQNYLER